MFSWSFISYESIINRYNNHSKGKILLYDFIALLIALITLAVSILINWKTLKKSIKHDDFASLRNSFMSIKRRQFLVASTTVVGIGTWVLLRSNSVNEKLKKLFLNFLPNNDMIVVNKKTGVIHHKILCKKHLPKSNNINNYITFNTKLRFHKTKKVAILTNLSQNTNAENAIDVLLLATENNPTAVHLYDALVKLLGKVKRYEVIHLLLNDAERKLTDKLIFIRKGTKEYKKITKALLHVQLQKSKSLNRARYRALKI